MSLQKWSRIWTFVLKLPCNVWDRCHKVATLGKGLRTRNEGEKRPWKYIPGARRVQEHPIEAAHNMWKIPGIMAADYDVLLIFLSSFFLFFFLVVVWGRATGNILRAKLLKVNIWRIHTLAPRRCTFPIRPLARALWQTRVSNCLI
jgi:hypothetical protein